MKPRIAIPLPTSNDLLYNELNWPAFADAVVACGGDPLRIPLHATPRELTELAYTCAAILLPGSPADVNPAKYGQIREEGTAATDLARENVDELLLQDAHNLYKPVLGVCFGMQMLNVWRSGTLVQDLVPLPTNHAAAQGVAIAHSVAVEPGSLLAETLLARAPSLPLDRLPINSSHHQAVGIAGDGLRISARSLQDQVVEAIEGGQAISYPIHAPGQQTTASHHFVLGVQWHPERSFTTDAASRALFEGFLEHAKRWLPRSVQVSVVVASEGQG